MNAVFNHIKLISLLLIIFISVKLNAQDLKTHQWENRIVIVYAKYSDSATFQKQIDALTNDTKGMAERKLILYKIVGNEYELFNFKDSDPIASGSLSKDFKDRYLNENQNFKLLLIGLDGSVKINQHQVLPLNKLYTTIDAMPMRRQEIRKKRDN